MPQARLRAKKSTKGLTTAFGEPTRDAHTETAAHGPRHIARHRLTRPERAEDAEQHQCRHRYIRARPRPGDLRALQDFHQHEHASASDQNAIR